MIQYQLVNGADIRGLDPAMRPVMVAAGKWRERNGHDKLVITCGLNGEHSAGSLHPYGLAIDLRTNDTSDQGAAYAAYLRERLGHGYDVILHSTHIHVEYDPK